jgi:ATP-dependent Clp protease adaptor protein ClpS
MLKLIQLVGRDHKVAVGNQFVSEDQDQIHEEGNEAEAVDDSATAVAAPDTKPAPPQTRQLPPFKVLLHNDDVNDVEHVVCSILKLTPLSVEEAVQRTLEAHHTGVALLLVTHRERGELYCEQFATYNLTVTLEPDA